MNKKVKDLTPEEHKRKLEGRKRYRDNNPDKVRTSQTKYVKKNPEKIKAIVKKFQLKYFAKLKKDAFDHYGGPVCKICGEVDMSELSTDHINNDGAEHRKEIFGDSRSNSGWHFYLWLQRNDYPNDIPLQVLCLDCNREKSGGRPPLEGLFDDPIWLQRNYYLEKRTLAEMGEECNVSLKTISNRMDKFGLRRRPLIVKRT